MNYNKVILSPTNIIKYCKQFKYPIVSRGQVLNLQCPFCEDESLTAQSVGQTHLINCLNPDCPHKDSKFTLVSVIRKAEPDKKDWGKEELVQYVKTLFKVKAVTAKDQEEIDKWFSYYEKHNFSLTPVKPNGKECIEKEWQNKEHKNKEEWLDWLKNGLNMGMNCGQSKKFVVDIDQKPIPKEIEELTGDTLIAETRKGFHCFYEQDIEIPKTSICEFILIDAEGKEHIIKNANFPIKLNNRKTTLRRMEIGEKTTIKINDEEKEVTMKSYLKIDLENSNVSQGAQVIVFPSVAEDVGRKFINENDIIELPPKFKEYLMERVGKVAISPDTLKQEIDNSDYKMPLIEDGEGRHDFLFRYACILRKKMSVSEVESAITSLNKIVCSPPMEYREIKNIINSTSQYDTFDHKELENKIIGHLTEVKEAGHKDLERIIYGDARLSSKDKNNIDKTIAYLIKEDLIFKKNRYYYPIQKIQWETSLIDVVKSVNFKMPYFHDVAHFKWGNMILIAANAKTGKTHIAMNIVKQLVIQGITPYYLSTESDSLFIDIGLTLGLGEGDFYHNFCPNPTKIKLEQNAVTIIDWLLIENKAETDLAFKLLSDELHKTNGLLIVFQQLKADNEYFAPNLAKQFPCLATRYLYDKEDDGTYGRFKVDERRRKIGKRKTCEIPCYYDDETSVLTRLDELKKDKTIKESGE